VAGFALTSTLSRKRERAIYKKNIITKSPLPLAGEGWVRAAP